MKKDDIKPGLKLNQSENFAFIEQSELKSIEMLDEANVYMDARTAMVSYKTDFSGLDWYTNYLDSVAYFARKNPKAYPQYLLQLGYIPVVYMPSCAGQFGVQCMTVLSNLKIPYVRMKATSFVIPYYQSDMVDAWCSKLDLGAYFGISPENVRSTDVVRRLFANG